MDFCHPVRADVLYREGMAVILFKKSTIGQQKLASLAQLLLHKDIKRLSEDFSRAKEESSRGSGGSGGSGGHPRLASLAGQLILCCLSIVRNA